MGAAPRTYQDQGLWTSRFQARRLPLAPLVPQTTVSSLPCPLVYCSHMLWLPWGSRVPLAHGRGVTRLHHPVAGYVGRGEGRTKQIHGGHPLFHPVSNAPPWWAPLSHTLGGPHRGQGRASWHSMPAPIGGRRPSARSSEGPWPGSAGTIAAPSDCNGSHTGPLPWRPTQGRGGHFCRCLARSACRDSLSCSPHTGSTRRRCPRSGSGR